MKQTRAQLAAGLLLVGCSTGAMAQTEVASDEAIQIAVKAILAMQEGEGNAEWPYEGVYRVPDPEGGRGSIIPIGYRVGGSSICALALMSAPGFADDTDRQEAVNRAVRFVIESREHPRMSHDSVPGSYDVRGWGYTYGLSLLLQCDHVAASDPIRPELEQAIDFYIDGIEATEIPELGGWNYARRGGFDRPSPMSPFMTAPTLQALFMAREQGYDVDGAMVERGLDALERARLKSGAYVYSGEAVDGGSRSQVPGAVARMTAAEATLFLADRATQADVRGAVDAFIVHWEWLDKRRAQNGTHIPPYGIAPYYFYYAHYYAAQAVELLPEQDRAEYRRKINELLFRNRLASGTWNDRVFERSANYGTAMSLMALMMDATDPPARWKNN